jgi:hypothetical protein
LLDDIDALYIATLVQRQLLLPVATTRFAGFRRLTC